MQTAQKTPELDDIHARLFSYSQGTEQDRLLACILASWQTGNARLPQWLGLQEQEFVSMLAYHFPSAPVNYSGCGNKIDMSRSDELVEVMELLLRYRANESESEVWTANIIAAACQAQDHLWQDLGVWSRKDLSLLMSLNFPELAARNDKNMKWKKFVYKQLCITEGIYTCRSPSCEVCIDYDNCFAPEE